MQLTYRRKVFSAIASDKFDKLSLLQAGFPLNETTSQTSRRLCCSPSVHRVHIEY